MKPAPEDPALAPWSGLRRRLAGRFTARARGLLAPELTLSERDGKVFGRLRGRGPGRADLEAGDLRAIIEPGATDGHHRMLAGDAEVLVSRTAGAANEAEVRCGGRDYEVRLRLARNTAVAHLRGDGEAVRVTGGPASRSYDVAFDAGDGGSLPVAVFVLYRLAALRRRAFTTGVGGRRP